MMLLVRSIELGSLTQGSTVKSSRDKEQLL